MRLLQHPARPHYIYHGVIPSPPCGRGISLRLGHGDARIRRGIPRRSAPRNDRRTRESLWAHPARSGGRRIPSSRVSWQSLVWRFCSLRSGCIGPGISRLFPRILVGPRETTGPIIGAASPRHAAIISRRTRAGPSPSPNEGSACREPGALQKRAEQASPFQFGGEWGPVTLVAFKAIDPVLRGQDGGFDSHTLPPIS